MNIGLNISEQEYRELDYPSYSLLSNIKKSGPTAVHGERVDISDYDGVVIGSLVDSIITEGGLPDNIELIEKKPTGKPLIIFKNLAKRTDLEDDNLLSSKNNKLIEEELDKAEYYSSSSFTMRLKKLKQYKKYAAVVKDSSKQIVSSYQFNEATALANNILLKYPFLLDGENTILTQVKLKGSIGITDLGKDVEVKGMLDFVVIDKKSKVITPFDLKTGIGAHDLFFADGFLGYNYYIQASLYKELLIQELSKAYKDYSIEDFRFMYCGRADRLPIVYRVSTKWHNAGLNGFDYKGRFYPGVYDLLKDYIHYRDNPNTMYKKGYEIAEVAFDDSFL